jgi:membrane protein
MPGEPSITSLAADLTAQAGDLVRNEIRLARAEAVESLKALGVAAVFGGLGVVMAGAALTLTLLGGAYLLALAMPFWAAALIMAALGAIVAYLLVGRARKIIATKPMQLPRTRHQLAQDISLIKEGPNNELRH